MGKKQVFLIIILVSVYIFVMVNYPVSWLKSIGYNQCLELYAQIISSHCNYEFIYNPGLRNLKYPDQMTVCAISPEQNSNFPVLLDNCLEAGNSCIIECSQLDTWHTTPAGLEYLQKIRTQAYRAIVFDGGHHLPSLGLAPDIIIVPQLAGYAVHGYMLDGIKVSEIERLARECDSPSVIVTVGRMALVKNKTCMENITQRILATCRVNQVENKLSPKARTRISKYNNMIFAYIDQTYTAKPDLFISRIEDLGIEGLKKIYLAFDFKYCNRKQADAYCSQMEQEFDIEVQRVNQPVKVFNVLWGGR